MDNDVLKIIQGYTESIKEINSTNIEINKKKDRNFLIAFLVTVVIFGLCLLYSLYQTYNYSGYPTSDIKNINNNTNNNDNGKGDK